MRSFPPRTFKFSCLTRKWERLEEVNSSSLKRRIHNLGQKVWKAFKFEALRRVINVQLHIPSSVVVKVQRESLMTMWRRRAKLFATKSLPFSYCHCLGISSWMCGADCWPVLKSWTEDIFASDSSSESSRPRWWLFMTDRSGLTSVKLSQNTQLLAGFFAMTELFAYVDFPILVSQKRN